MFSAARDVGAGVLRLLREGEPEAAREQARRLIPEELAWIARDR
jgi:hypothetical protein